MKIYGFIHKLVIEITKEPELLFKLWNTLWKIFDIFDAKRLIFREIKSILAYFSAKFRHFDEVWFHLTKNSSFWQFFIFSRQIDEIHTSQYSVEKLSKTHSLFFRKNQHFFHQINVFTKEVAKELISRKNFHRDRVFKMNFSTLWFSLWNVEN